VSTRPVEPLEQEVELAGERLLLLPERAALWPARETLLVADPHWGKAAAFRAGGLPVPQGTTEHGLRRLDDVLARHPVHRIVYLGDYFHAREGRAAGTLARLRAWGDAHPDVEQLLVRGNHDRGAGDPPDELRVRCVEAPHLEGPFAFRHFPTPHPDLCVLAGHLHPAVRLVGRGRQRARLPCFWLRPGVAVLPSFGDFTGSAEIVAEAEDRVFVVAGDAVLPVGR
jgi:uncharacterized protein